MLFRSPRFAAGPLLAITLSIACGGNDSTGPVVPANIVITPNHPDVGQGLSLQLTGTVVDATGRAIPGTLPFFTSADPQIATVTAGGLVHSPGPTGQVRITAEFAGVTNFVDLAVRQRIVKLVVTPDHLTLNRYLTSYLQLQMQDFLGNPGYTLPTFVSSDTDVVTTDPFGGIHAKGVSGQATVTVGIDSLTATVPVTVTQIPSTIGLATPNLVIHPGASGQLIASVRDLHGDPITGAILTYVSSAPSVFSVSATGLVTSLGPTGSGTVTITGDTLVASAGIFVGDGPAGVLVHTTPLGMAAYEAAVATSGRMAVSGVTGSAGLLGTLPAYDFPGTVTVDPSPLGVAVNHAGTRAYIAGQPSIAVIDLSTGSRLGDLTGFGGGTRFSVAVSGDDQRLYVGTDYGVYAMDLTTGQAVDSIATSTALFLALDPAHPRLYVSVDGGQVMEILLGPTMTAGRTFAVTAGPKGIGVAPDGSELYATSEGGGVLEVWNLASGQRTQSVTLQGGGFGLAVSQDRIAVAESVAGLVQLFDRASRVPAGVVAVGGTPRRPAWDASGTMLVVPNEAGWVDFIQ
jgi:hypothetical protein